MPLFRRYIFVWIEDTWWPLKSTPYVVDLLMDGEAPGLVPKKKIEKIRGMEVGGVVVLPKKEKSARVWERGDVLRVTDTRHILGGRNVIYQGQNDKERENVLLSWMGKNQVVAVPRRILELA